MRNNLKKDLPRIPFVKKYTDYISFSDAGKKLADIHINYEKAKLYKLKVTKENVHKLIENLESISAVDEASGTAIAKGIGMISKIR